jgi:hypothetical protein
MIDDMVPPWGTKVHYMSGIHTNVTTVQLPSGQARYSYLRDKPQNGEMTPLWPDIAPGGRGRRCLCSSVNYTQEVICKQNDL